MKWTKAKPGACGWYWCFTPAQPGWQGAGPTIREFIMFVGVDHPEPRDGPYSSEGWQFFAGPIKEPTGPLPVPPDFRDQGAAI